MLHSPLCGGWGGAKANPVDSNPVWLVMIRKRPNTDACAPSSAPAAAVEYAAQYIAKPIKHFSDFQIGSDEHLNYLGIYP